jgi:hypothetical protein
MAEGAVSSEPVSQTGRLWVYARDDCPWAGPDPPAAVYFYSPDRKAERPAAHLERFRGILQVDGYAGFETLAESGEVVLAACWAHARRKFYEFHQATGSPIAAEALRRITELYAVEKRIRGQPAEARRLARKAESRPLIEAMKPWLDDQLRRVPPRGGLDQPVDHLALARQHLRHVDGGGAGHRSEPIGVTDQLGDWRSRSHSCSGGSSCWGRPSVERKVSSCAADISGGGLRAANFLGECFVSMPCFVPPCPTINVCK